MTAFWLNLLLLPTWDLPPLSDFDRFPPPEVVAEWAEANASCCDWITNHQEKFPADGWRAAYAECSEAGQALSLIGDMHADRPCQRRAWLKELKNAIRPEWYACPAIIPIVPYKLLQAAERRR